MESIRIQRLRCLSDTDDVKIKPIAVLLGENNSGKSTFLRFFPLLKQSIETRTRGPILWNGRLVDFGRYEDAHQKGSAEGISFYFQFIVKSTSEGYFYNNLNVLNDLKVSLELKISEDKESHTTKISGLRLIFADSKIEIDFSENGTKISKFLINSLDVLNICNTLLVINESESRDMLPIIVEKVEHKTSSLEEINFLKLGGFYFPSIFWKLEEIIKNLCHHFTSESTIFSVTHSLGIGSSEDMLKNIKESNTKSKTWHKNIQSWTVKNKKFQEIRDLTIANFTFSLMQECDKSLSYFSRKISYMGPVRASAERYYRTQDLAVDEVDSKGSNLAMFLRNLTEQERSEFATWTLHNFGFRVSLELSQGHISVYLYLQNSESNVNVADTGFGFSQILPVITQLWLLTRSSRDTLESREARDIETPKIFAIEQPELHLHPHLQGVLAEAFVTSIKAAREEEIDFRLIIETHSEVLINKLGHLVADRKIDPEDINIVLFEKSQDSQETKVRFANFDENGYLSEDWPLGFFDMDLI